MGMASLVQAPDVLGREVKAELVRFKNRWRESQEDRRA